MGTYVLADLPAPFTLSEDKLSLTGLCANPSDGAMDLLFREPLFSQWTTDATLLRSLNVRLSKNTNPRMVSYLISRQEETDWPDFICFWAFSGNACDLAVNFLIDRYPDRIDFAHLSRNHNDRAFRYLTLPQNHQHICFQSFCFNRHPEAPAFAVQFLRRHTWALAGISRRDPMCEWFYAFYSLERLRDIVALLFAARCNDDDDDLTKRILRLVEPLDLLQHQHLYGVLNNTRDDVVRMVLENRDRWLMTDTQRCHFATNPHPAVISATIEDLRRQEIQHPRLHNMQNMVYALCYNLNLDGLRNAAPMLQGQKIPWDTLAANPAIFVINEDSLPVLK